MKFLQKNNIWRPSMEKAFYFRKFQKTLNWLVHGIIIIIFYNLCVTHLDLIFICIDAIIRCLELLQFFMGLTVIRLNEFPWKIQIDSINKNDDGPPKSNIFAESLWLWKFQKHNCNSVRSDF